jgi:hypothetical protein
MADFTKTHPPVDYLLYFFTGDALSDKGGVIPTPASTPDLNMVTQGMPTKYSPG